MKMYPLDFCCREKTTDESRGHTSINQLTKLNVTTDALQPIAALTPGSEHQMERIVLCSAGSCQISDMLLHTATHVVSDMQYPWRISQAKQLQIAAYVGVQHGVFSDPVLHQVREVGVAIIDNLLGLGFQLL